MTIITIIKVIVLTKTVTTLKMMIYRVISYHGNIIRKSFILISSHKCKEIKLRCIMSNIV
jgi:hypothetical protein